MIIALTPNPSVDRTIRVPQLRFNEILRAERLRLDFGGKGFNVSRGLKLLDTDSLALAWVGGGAGRMVEDGLKKMGIQTDFVWVDEETRTNTLAHEDGGEWYIRLNEAGPHVPEEAVKALFEKAESYLQADDIWVVSGSLPQDVPPKFYSDLISMLRAKGARVFFDANDQSLREGIAARPFLVKPDALEVENYVGFPLRNYDDGKRAALAFLRQGVENVAIAIMGTGVVLASQHQIVLATIPKVPQRNNLGAGDALMAGLVYGFANHMEFNEIARWGAAFSGTVITHEAISQATREDVTAMLPRVEVRLLNLL